MSKIGILGGTFNPIHNGHILLGEYCRQELGLDKVMFIPTSVPPHKLSPDLVSEEHRLNMCNIAIKNKDYFDVSDIEIQRKGKSYTYQTITSLKEIYPNDELYLIMGADMFITLDKWMNPQIIFDNSSIIAVPRNSSDCSSLKEYYENVIKEMGAKVYILSDSVMYVSSTYIRDNIENYELISNLLDKNVYKYIVENNLYRK